MTYTVTVEFLIDGVNDEQEAREVLQEASDLFQEHSIYPYNTLSEPHIKEIKVEEDGFESLRHRVSGLLMDTDEDHPIPVSFPLYTDDPETCGLSTLDLPWVESAFQVPGDGTIWVNMDYYDDPKSDKKAELNFDDLSPEDAKRLADELEEYHEKQGTLKNIYIN